MSRDAFSWRECQSTQNIHLNENQGFKEHKSIIYTFTLLMKISQEIGLGLCFKELENSLKSTIYRQNMEGNIHSIP